MATWFSRTYRAPTESEVLVRFTADAQAIERSGFRPALQTWNEADGDKVLVVAYKRVSIAPRAADDGPVPDDERIASLRRVVGLLGNYGWRAEQLSDFSAVVAQGGNGLSPSAHAAHGCLTLLTAGLWGIVWFIHYRRGPTRRFLAIDGSGVIAAGVYKPGANTPPRLGPPVSDSKVIDLPQRQRLITILTYPVMVHIATTLLIEVEGEQEPPVHLERIDKVPTRYYEFEVYLSANADPGTKLAWFILN
jgi:hypothetical protein